MNAANAQAVLRIEGSTELGLPQAFDRAKSAVISSS
jgi:hypothetical protein